MHQRGLCRHAVCIRLSVCLSVTSVHSVETNKHIFKIFSLPSSQAILVFRTKRHGTTPTGTPQRGRRMQGGMKKLRFSTNISLISEMMQDRAIANNNAIVTMEGE